VRQGAADVGDHCRGELASSSPMSLVNSVLSLRVSKLTTC
jgi:hypothetical protein